MEEDRYGDALMLLVEGGDGLVGDVGGAPLLGAEMKSWMASAPISWARAKTLWGPPEEEMWAPTRMAGSVRIDGLGRRFIG